MTEDQVREHLRKAVTSAGGQRAWARANGLSAAYVNDVLLGRRAPADKICAALGVTRQVTFGVKFSRGKP